MSNPWLYALTFGPLGFYLWVIAFWHSFRHPRVVSGPVDFTFLAVGVGGVLAIGPAGQFAARAVFGRTQPTDWLTMLSVCGLAACLFARRSLNRLVVYHVDPPSLVAAVGAVLRDMEGPFHRTLTGFEDRTHGRGLTIEASPWLRSGVVVAFGQDAEALIHRIGPRLEERLRAVATGPSPVALIFYGLSLLVMVAPVVGLYFSEPRARAALRAFFERLTGG